MRFKRVSSSVDSSESAPWSKTNASPLVVPTSFDDFKALISDGWFTSSITSGFYVMVQPTERSKSEHSLMFLATSDCCSVHVSTLFQKMLFSSHTGHRCSACLSAASIWFRITSSWMLKPTNLVSFCWCSSLFVDVHRFYGNASIRWKSPTCCSVIRPFVHFLLPLCSSWLSLCFCVCTFHIVNWKN